MQRCFVLLLLVSLLLPANTRSADVLASHFSYALVSSALARPSIQFAAAGLSSTPPASTPASQATLPPQGSPAAQQAIITDQPAGEPPSPQSFTGLQDSGQFGAAVSTAGDMNGDGLSDIVIGAPESSGGGSAAILLGNATEPISNTTTPPLEIAAPVGASRFGAAVSIAGDVNGDGFSDIIIGAPDAQSAYVFYGAASGSITGTDVILTQGTADFGAAVGTAGDVNGDGFSDVIVGEPGNDSAYVFYGAAAGLSTTPAVTLSQGGQFGSAVDTAGNVNGDDYADVIIGAPGADTAYVYLGPDLTTSIALAGSNQFGSDVSTAGDIDGDGLSDVLIGAAGNDQAALYLGDDSSPTPNLSPAPGSPLPEGAAVVSVAGDIDGDGYADVLVGSTDAVTVFVGPDLTPLPMLTGDAGSGFGSAVSTAGDIDGDGFADILVGAPLADSAYGQVVLYRGEPGLFGPDPTGDTVSYTSADWVADGIGPDGGDKLDYFGALVNSAGDVNGDGYGDVVVSTIDLDQDDEDPNAINTVFVYHGSANGLNTDPAVQMSNDSLFGISAGSAGDVNGDGYDDIIIGQSGNPSVPGSAFVYCGSSTGIATTPCWTGNGADEKGGYGFSVASAGDVNGDGFADIIVGEPELESDINTPVGQAYVYYGSPEGPSTTADWITTGRREPALNNSALLGRSVGSAGDVNGDGYSDIIIGAPGVDQNPDNRNEEGQVYIYHGSADGLSDNTPDSTSIPDKQPDLIIEGDPNPEWREGFGDENRAQFGDSVGTAGDLNGDGYSDIIALAGYPNDGDAINNSRARAFVYSGSPTGIQETVTLSYTLYIRGAPRQEGYNAVGSAGDVNGDGLSDLILGSVLQDQALIYLGSPDGVSQEPDIAIRGAKYLLTGSRRNTFAFSVANAGDVNGDGYGDVIIGTPERPGEEERDDKNKAYAFYGNNGGAAASQTLRLRQLRRSDETQIPHLGLADSSQEMRIGIFGRMPLGRAQVRMQWQLEAFDPAVQPGFPASADSGNVTAPFTTGSYNTAVIPGLSLGQQYHWRVRLLYPAGNRLGLSASRWMHIPWNSWTEQDFRTEVSAALFSSSPTRAGTTTTLTATLSGVENLEAITYRWDFDSDGTFDVTVSPLALDAQNVQQYRYVTGEHMATVEIVYTIGGQQFTETASTHITVFDSAPLEPFASNDSPTPINSTTTLSASLIGATALEYAWDFEGDGITDLVTTTTSVSNVYAAAGSYQATVSISHTLESESPITTTTTVIILEEAIAGLTASSDSPTPLGQPTTLTADIQAGTNISYTWDFDSDGTIDDTSPNNIDSPYSVEFVYPATGVYTATVTASNSTGTQQQTVLVTITDEPIAGLTADNDSPTALGAATTLSSTITAGDNVEYAWDFGDGSQGSGAVTTHVYNQVGPFEAVVTARNSSSDVLGDSTASTQGVIVEASALSISKSSHLAQVRAGAAVTYTLTVNNSNSSGTTIPGVVITDTIPADTTLLRILDGGERVAGSNIIRWEVGILPEGDSVSVRFVVTVGGTDQQTITIINQDYGVSAPGGFRDTSDAISVQVLPTNYFTYMPIMLRQEPKDPDLVIESISLNPNKLSFTEGEAVQITVVIRNDGDAATINGFWVDLFIDPQQPPTPGNLPTTWERQCSDPATCQGISWRVDERIEPGETVTLTSTPDSYSVDNTRWSGAFESNTTNLYLYVDAWNVGGLPGVVNESNENNNSEALQVSVP